MTQKLEFHPVADLFPLLQGEAFQKLVADIQQNGLIEPILVDTERRIIDGRNRTPASKQASCRALPSGRARATCPTWPSV